ncbi:sulfuric ester hydrolase [Aureococcus anophagefferens]|nr:sulfuric ester hydrolase [Aureococcus anophagefferens]
MARRALLLAGFLAAASGDDGLLQIRLATLESDIDALLTVPWPPLAVTAQVFATGLVGSSVVGDLASDDDLRSTLWLLIRSMRAQAAVYMIYVGDENGTFVGYYGEGQTNRGGDFYYTMLDGPACDFSGACRKYFDFCFADDYYDVASYDPRARPWYAGALETAASASWSDVYIFADDAAPGISAVDRLYDADGSFAGVAAVDYKLSAIEGLVAAAYNYSEDGSIAFIVEPDGDLIAASLPNVALAYDASGDLAQVPAADCSAPLIRAAYAHGGDSELDLLTVDGAQYWILRSVLADAFGLRWNFTALHPTECPAGYGLEGLACAQCDPEDHMTSDAGSTLCDTCAEGYYKYAKDGEQRCAACSDAGDCDDLGLDPDGPTPAAIAAMAADHFNARNTTIIDWGVGDCDAKLQLTFHETRTVASEGIPAYYDANEFLDVVVGPAASAVAEPLATLAEIDDVPLISYAAGSALLDEYAYFARANPSVEASADAVADWYATHGWSHAAILYEKTNTYGLTAMEAFRTAAGFRGVSVASSGYDAGDAGSLGSALDSVLAATYDVVYAILDPSDLGLLVAAAADRNVTGGDLHWVFGDSPSAADVEAAAAAGYADVLRGSTQVSACVYAVDRSRDDATNAAFDVAYATQSVEAFNRRSKMAGPRAVLPAGFFGAEPDAAARRFAYDAVAAVGLAACAVGPGLAVNEGGANSCQRCDSTSFAAAPGSSTCESCGADAFILGYALGSTSRNDCACLAGTYADGYPLTRCRSCPDDASCDGGLTGPYPKRNFWLSGVEYRSTVEAYRCKHAYLCPGGKGPATCASGDYGPNNCVDADNGNVSLTDHDWCATGYSPKQPLCEGNKHGFFFIDTQATSCPDMNAALFTVLCWIGLLGSFVVINDVIRPQYPMLDVVLGTYQDLGIVGGLWFHWPRSLNTVFFVFTIALFDVDIYSPTCWFPTWSSTHTFALMLTLPLFFWVVKAVRFLLTTKRDENAKDDLLCSGLSFLVGSQASLITYCLRPFACRSIAGVGRVRAHDPTKACGTDAIWYMRVVGVVYAGSVVVLLTAAICYHLNERKNENRLHDPQTLRRFGFMYTPFRSHARDRADPRDFNTRDGSGSRALRRALDESTRLALYWNLVRLAKQAVLVAIQVLLWEFPMAQGLASIFVLLGPTVAEAWVRPNLSDEANTCEIGGNCLTILVLVMGIVFTNGGDTPTAPFEVCFFIAQILYLCYALRATVEKTGKPMPDLEIFDTFDGATLLRLVHDETFDTDNALPLVLELERVLADYVSDSSLVSNFNKSHTATFYRRLIRFMPGLPDIVVEAPAEERRQLANAVVHCVRDIDQSSVLYFALHARANDVEQFGDFLLRLINSTQKLRRSRRNLLKHRATIAIQRAWRRRKLGAAGAILAHLEATSGKHVTRRTFRARNSVTGGSADYPRATRACARASPRRPPRRGSWRPAARPWPAAPRPRPVALGRGGPDRRGARRSRATRRRRARVRPGPVDEPPPERDQRSRIFGVMVGDSWVNDVVCYSNGADRDDHVVVCYSNEGEQDERAVAKARQQASRLPVEVP